MCDGSVYKTQEIIDKNNFSKLIIKNIKTKIRSLLDKRIYNQLLIIFLDIDYE